MLESCAPDVVAAGGIDVKASAGPPSLASDCIDEISAGCIDSVSAEGIEAEATGDEKREFLEEVAGNFLVLGLDINDSQALFAVDLDFLVE